MVLPAVSEPVATPYPGVNLDTRYERLILMSHNKKYYSINANDYSGLSDDASTNQVLAPLVDKSLESMNYTARRLALDGFVHEVFSSYINN